MRFKLHWQQVLGAAVILTAAGSVFAGGLRPASSSNGADVLFDVTCTAIWVDVSGNSEPLFPDGSGGIVVELPDSVEVITPSTSGKDNFRCHGRLPLGEQVPAMDVVTGEWIIATLASRNEACSAMSELFPKVCRGANGPLVINVETTPFECFTVIDGVEFSTARAHAITTSSGATNVNCHFDLDAQPAALLEPRTSGSADHAISVLAATPHTTLRHDEFLMGSANNNFARKVAGSFFLDFEFAGLPLKALLVVHADGTVTSHLQQSFGAPTGVPEAAIDFNGPLYGNWIRTDSRQITIDALQMLYENPDFSGAHGTLTQFARVSAELDYSGDFDQFHGSIVIELFTPDQDPLVDEPVGGNEIPLTGRRIQ